MSDDKERDRLYSIWTSMKSRCRNEKDADYARYGGRGIQVCERWRNSFEDFRKDMGERKEGETLDRIDNDGNYEPKNCKWVDRKTQARNRSTTKNFADSHEFDAEIFSVGTWNGDPYTLKDLEEMAQNFKTLSDEIKPPVKLGHDNKIKSDSMPALGWVTGLRVAGKKLIATLSQVPDVLYRAVKKGLYKRVSSEIMWDYKQPKGKTFRRVLAGVALLGADIPAVKNLEDLEAFLTQTIDGDSFDVLKAYSFDATGGDVITIETDVNKEVINMSDDKIKILTDQYEKMKAENERLAKEKADLLEANIKKEREGQHQSLAAFCDQKVKDGVITPAQRDAIVIDDESKRFYSEGNVVISVEMFKKFVEKSDKKLDTKEHGKKDDGAGEGSAHDQIAAKVKTYLEKHEVDHETAYKRVLEDNPELAEAYTKGGD